jgi:hypothetical protein
MPPAAQYRLGTANAKAAAAAAYPGHAGDVPVLRKTS